MQTRSAAAAARADECRLSRRRIYTSRDSIINSSSSSSSLVLYIVAMLLRGVSREWLLVSRPYHAKNPSFPPFAFAVLIIFCRCFVVAPNSVQKSPIS